jgi:hypothetical protein
VGVGEPGKVGPDDGGVDGRHPPGPARAHYATYYLAAPLRRLVALGYLGGRASSIIDAYLTAFLDRAVRGRAEPLLTAASDRYPEVRIGHLPS